MSRALALIDGNSFYCSCERVFDPKLAGVPVIMVVPARAGVLEKRGWSTKFEMRPPLPDAGERDPVDSGMKCRGEVDHLSNPSASFCPKVACNDLFHL
ncbi:hypothetical protein [Methylobacterium gregans]|uniref:UmuC domain-containing protein n=1 Tax=Methylobacterium gregans TaxID=374424 RepID=A0AA37M9H8_9HYPH|nr:hypothetical protein [Methylobacterium gregans]MDQ0520044.1 hypothetical protein [Methylobacterium gregans]GJD77013.1 hypothetical protein NBEOAGPD_0214 [Methylobacterium gregans]GLS52445.1 hypothetical protein GCM10007886_06280 [Methylobacterium gregans]